VRTKKLWVVAGATLAVLSTLLIGGCSQGAYYAHSLFGGAKILTQRRAIERIVRDPEVDSTLRERLERALEIREFASRELGLPDNKSYRTYVELDRDYVSWTVTAAPEFSVSPVTWCFPIAGCVSYKGFFTEEKAEALATELREQGLDVSSGGVSAYSTLGWFADPILSTFLGRSEVDLAGLIFHELAHQVVYVKNGTEFNESFATAVELEGVRRWIASRTEESQSEEPQSEEPHAEAAIQAYRQSQERQDEFVHLVLRHRQQLTKLYATDLPEGSMRKEKKRIFGDLQRDLISLRENWNSRTALSGWIDADLNNANLAAVGAYHGWVGAFEAILGESTDLPHFYERVAELAALSPVEREERLASYRGDATDSSAVSTTSRIEGD